MKERRLTLISPKRPVDIVVFGLIAASTLVISIVGINSDLLTVLAFITVFFIPGYALQAAIFPESRIWTNNNRVPDIFERLAISFILSFLIIALSTSVLGGGLGVVFIDINKDLAASIVLIITALASIAAVDRRLAVPKPRAFRVELHIKPHVSNGMEKLLAAAAVVLITIAGVNAILQMDNPSNEASFTAFAIYGPNGDIGSLPSNIVAGNATNLIIFIECKENHNTQYRLTVTLDNRSSFESRPLNLANVNPLVIGTGFVTDIELVNGEKWSNDFRFSISAPGVHKLFLTLEVPGEPSEELWLWVNVT
jgi:uncharacterized membrane protein